MIICIIASVSFRFVFPEHRLNRLYYVTSLHFDAVKYPALKPLAGLLQYRLGK